MVKTRNLVIIAVVLFSLIISGCADKESTTQEQSELSETADKNISVADELLSEEMVGITDTEMQDLEADLAELEAMLGEMDLEEDIVIEEI
jgi:outer membrane murein-binding lipoprotein Lpp